MNFVDFMFVVTCQRPLSVCHTSLSALCLYLNPLQNDEFRQPLLKKIFETLMEKGKMLVTSISSFSYSDFYLFENENYDLKKTKTFELLSINTSFMQL